MAVIIPTVLPLPSQVPEAGPPVITVHLSKAHMHEAQDLASYNDDQKKKKKKKEKKKMKKH